MPRSPTPQSCAFRGPRSLAMTASGNTVPVPQKTSLIVLKAPTPTPPATPFVIARNAVTKQSREDGTMDAALWIAALPHPAKLHFSGTAVARNDGVRQHGSCSAKNIPNRTKSPLERHPRARRYAYHCSGPPRRAAPTVHRIFHSRRGDPAWSPVSGVTRTTAMSRHAGRPLRCIVSFIQGRPCMVARFRRYAYHCNGPPRRAAPTV